MVRGIVAALALVLMLGACNLGRSLFFSPGKVDGCMYWRGLAVHSACIARVGAEGTISQRDLADCIRSHTEFPEERMIEIATADGKRLMRVCAFTTGNDARLYYRYEPEAGLVFARRADCRAGCRFENRTWRVSFEGDEVRFEMLFEKIE
ncbi:MAG: hypothetical protein FWD15_06085 [Alphaproteobacteria bacterium]|nr:hypothetical protein [Alphaproteobacteria bacterium]